MKSKRKASVVFIIMLTTLCCLSISSMCWAVGITYGFYSATEVIPEDSLIFNCFGEGDAIYTVVTENGLEFRADGAQTGYAGMLWNRTIPVAQADHGLKIQVNFNSEACTSGAMMGVAIANATTDADQFDEFIAFVNGQNTDAGMINQSWGALSFMDGDLVDSVTEETDITSGTFYIIYDNSTFYFSTSSGLNSDTCTLVPADIFASFTVDHWTSCENVLIKVFGWSDQQALAGDGSNFDRFGVDFYFLPGDCGVSVGEYFEDEIFFDVSGTWVGEDRDGNVFEITIDVGGPGLIASTPYGEYSGQTGLYRNIQLTGPGEDGNEMQWDLVLSEDGTELTGTYTDIIEDEEAGSGPLSFVKGTATPHSGGSGGGGTCFISSIQQRQ